MFRRDLIPLLLDRAMTVHELSRAANQSENDTTADLEHLLRSLKHTEYKPVLDVAQCRKCGFEFGSERLRKPSKCPKCKGTWITGPRIQLARR
jgi:hypothetical protein